MVCVTVCLSSIHSVPCPRQLSNYSLLQFQSVYKGQNELVKTHLFSISHGIGPKVE